MLTKCLVEGEKLRACQPQHQMQRTLEYFNKGRQTLKVMTSYKKTASRITPPLCYANVTEVK